MRPAFSVLLLTTLVGCAQGLAVALAWALLFGPAPVERLLALDRVGLGIVLALGGIGLLASFAHLGRPERAWRAAAMWRTSWLSREVIALPVFLGFTALSLAVVWRLHRWPVGLALLLMVAALALWLCTAMIYAGVRFVREWATPLTVLNFLLMGLASGCAVAATLALWLAPELAADLGRSAAGLLAVALAGRLAALYRASHLTPAGSMQSAIGVASPFIRQTSKGFTAGAFNTREFFHGRSRSWLHGVRWGFPLLGFVVPLVLLTTMQSAVDASVWWPVALLCNLLGLLLERWDFFAQVTHPQNRYYQSAL